MRKILIIFCAMFIGTAYACESNEIDILGDGTQCETAKFTITTTELEPDTEFKFYMSAQGTFYVDWGDGTIDTIARTNTTETLYDHTYTTAGVKTIRFGGLATGYDPNRAAAIRFSKNDATSSLIADIYGSIGQIFPSIDNATVKHPSFSSTFAATKIIQIPPRLFYGVTGGVAGTFSTTFSNCPNLRAIPEGLFDGITSGESNMFYKTFSDSYYIESIPDRLFADIKNCAPNTFFGTFGYCRHIKGFVPPSMFAGLIQSECGDQTMYSVFNGSGFDTTCPTGTVQFVTGYEDKWNGAVSCVDENLVCGAGEYLPAHWYKCEPCPENNYCVGGTYPYSETMSNGATQCPTGLFAPNGMWEPEQCGRILHVGDGFVYLRSTKKTSPSLHLDLDHDGVADYFGNMTTMDVPMSRDTQRKLKVRYNNTTYSIYDDSVEIPTE